MKKWIPKVVPVEETTEDKAYFVVRGTGTHGKLFVAETNKGKQRWATKPGMAVRAKGGPVLVEWVNRPHHKEMGVYVVEVPPDADKRWKRWGRR